MNRRVACAALSSTLALALWSWPSSARACSCMKPPPPREAAAAATLVFEGRVTGMTEDQPPGSFLVYHVYELDVARVWKGEAGDRLTIRTTDNSASCGRAFEIGETYVVYARDVEHALSDDLCSRTRRLADAAEDLAALGTAVGEPEPPPRPPAPEPPRIAPDDTRVDERADEPPAPAPASRGCGVHATDADPHVSLASLVSLVFVGAWSRRRKQR